MADIAEDWWPDFIPPLTDATFVAGEHVTVAEIVQPTGEGSYRQVFTALAPPGIADRILATPGSIGYEVSASGPHPSFALEDEPGGYDPRFWIFGGEAAPDGLEPLVVSWRSADKTILRPDQGFLMTYALVPRAIRRPDGRFEENWDNNETPKADIVVSQPISIHDFPTTSPAWVRIRKEYLEDYAFVRGCCLLRVVYGHAEGAIDRALFETLRAAGDATIKSPGLEIWVRPTDETGNVHIRYWATHLLLRPERSPVTAGRWDYGALLWPGLQEPLTDPHRLPLMDYICVRDAVLAPYEGRVEEGFRIVPESGAVRYRGQWAVGYIRRFGRDLLRLEVRKLYEGCPPAVVKHWHQYAVEPPPDILALRGQANVGSRARRTLFGLLQLGESLADLATITVRRPVVSSNMVGLDRGDIEYRGWWTVAHVEPTTRHIPLDIARDRFLERMMALEKLVVEAFSEKALRELVVTLGYDPKRVAELGSLKLLDRIACHCAMGIESGLDVVRDSGEIRRRLVGKEVAELAAIYALYAFRTITAHRAGSDESVKIEQALAVLEIDITAAAAGWGLALDQSYDKIAEALENLAALIGKAIDATHP